MYNGSNAFIAEPKRQEGLEMKYLSALLASFALLVSPVQAGYRFMGCSIDIDYKHNLPQPYSNFIESEVQAWGYNPQLEWYCTHASALLAFYKQVALGNSYEGAADYVNSTSSKACFPAVGMQTKGLAVASRSPGQNINVLIYLSRDRNGRCLFTGYIVPMGER